jgi:hypothetical protein
LAAGRPHLSEGAIEFGDGGASYFDSRVPPRLYAGARIADPHPPHAQAGDKTDPPVNAEHLAMITPEPTEGAVEPRRVETPRLDAGLAQTPPEPVGRRTESAHPIVNQSDPHAVASLRDERVGEDPALLVLVNDVTFEMDCVSSRFDRFEPSRIIFSGVFEDARAIARDQPGSGGAPERLFGEDADGGRRAIPAPLRFPI